MSLSLGWLLLVLATGATGAGLFRSWRRGELNPPEVRVGVHGGLALIVCAGFLLAFDARTALGNPELIGLVLVIGSGAMMFGARRRAKHCPPHLLWIHVTSFVGLCLAVAL